MIYLFIMQSLTPSLPPSPNTDKAARRQGPTRNKLPDKQTRYDKRLFFPDSLKTSEVRNNKGARAGQKQRAVSSQTCGSYLGVACVDVDSRTATTTADFWEPGGTASF